MPSFPTVVSLIDAYNRPVKKSFEIFAADHAAAKLVAATVMTAFANITESRILYYTISEKVVFSDTVTVGANRDEGATVSVLTTDNGKATIAFPSPINTIFDGNGNIDLTNATFTAFMAPFLDGDVLVDDGETVAEIVSGSLDD